MILISGKAQKIKKGYYKCPNDGIHRQKKSGGIRGFWGLRIAESNIYYGNWAYYIDIGYKVFYSFKFARTSKTMEEVHKTVEVMQLLEDFCPKIQNIDEVKTDVKINGRRHCAVSPSLLMQHVYYPEKAWLKFAKGKPYDWKAVKHIDHSVEGFKEFRSELENYTKDIDYNFDSFSIGNIVWCTEQNRWYLVDVR